MIKLPGAVLLLVCLQMLKPDCLCCKLPLTCEPSSALTCCERVISREEHFLPRQPGARRGGPSVSGNSAEITAAHSSAARVCLERAGPRSFGEVSFSGNYSPALRSFSETQAHATCGAQKAKPLFSVEFKLQILEEKWCMLVARSLVCFI